MNAARPEPDPPPEPGAWKAAFLSHLRASPNVSAAARHARVNRQYAYEARESDPDFAAGWADAIAESVDALEERVFRSTEKIDKVSAPLAVFLLRAHRPAVYGNKATQEHTGTVKVMVEYESGDPPYADSPPPGPAGPGEVDG